MKMKKGKVYPSSFLPSSSSSHYLDQDDSLYVLRLLPTTILVLVSVLSAEDREVLAYLITRGNCGRSSSSSSSFVDSKKNKSSKNHKPPVFDCECFDCYTNYWFRWDSSPNRDLIHEIIEAFENHQLSENLAFRNKSKRGKKKEKSGHRVELMTQPTVSETSPDNSPETLDKDEAAERNPQYDEKVAEEEESPVIFPVTTGHKGLARKVLPDVLGLFNSNFWRLWNPNA